VASVVDAWYPGQSSGTALANVLFGQANPSGHLPVTFPRRATFTVTPPAYAPSTSQTVHATADLGGSDTREAGVTVTVGG
jgi:beta-glucosidase